MKPDKQPPQSPAESSGKKLSPLDQLERRVEAMLFAAGEPLDGGKIAEILNIERTMLQGLVRNIQDRYQAQNSPIYILTLDGKYQMTTLPQFAEDIRKALEVGRGGALSQAALEVLAVIAYNQPITRAFVEEVRGVDCSGHMRNLTEKGLIEETGRMNIPGNPIIYQTTPNFLRAFGLTSLQDLPVLPESVAEEEEDTNSPELEGQTGLFDFSDSSLDTPQ